MKLFDCHLHTDLSFDSREPMENYVKQAVATGDDYFISTEHFDLESHIMDGGDIAADLDRQQQIIAHLNEKYPINVLFGVEIGWYPSIHHRDVAVAASKPFDMIILSVHETEYSDVATPVFKEGKTTDQCYDEYLDCIIDAINNFDNFDTFAHIDYVLRYVGHTELSKHKEKLTKVFTMLIERGKALEINTKTFPDPQAIERMEYIVKLYSSLGGTMITLGSDAHMVSRHKNGFDTVKACLAKNGIHSTTVFVGRKPHQISF